MLKFNFINPAIDSMTVITPVELLVIPDTFYSKITTFNETTGEILSSEIKPIVSDIDGIKIRVLLVNLFGKNYLSVTYSSKFLKENYFKGIKLDNFKDCFNYFISISNISCDYLEYLNNSIVFDLDFKADFVENDEHFSDFLSNHKLLNHCKLYRAKQGNYLNNSYYVGMQFINRKDANLSHPFVKFYSKLLELEQRSNLFMSLFLKDVYISPFLRRIEVTLKNHLFLKNSIYQINYLTF